MFKTVNEFESAALYSLKAIIDEKDWLNPPDTLNKTDYNDVLKFIYDEKLITGVNGGLNANNQMVFQRIGDGGVRLTHAGLKWIEDKSSKHEN